MDVWAEMQMERDHSGILRSGNMRRVELLVRQVCLWQLDVLNAGKAAPLVFVLPPRPALSSLRDPEPPLPPSPACWLRAARAVFWRLLSPCPLPPPPPPFAQVPDSLTKLAKWYVTVLPQPPGLVQDNVDGEEVFLASTDLVATCHQHQLPPSPPSPPALPAPLPLPSPSLPASPTASPPSHTWRPPHPAMPSRAPTASHPSHRRAHDLSVLAGALLGAFGALLVAVLAWMRYLRSRREARRALLTAEAKERRGRTASGRHSIRQSTGAGSGRDRHGAGTSDVELVSQPSSAGLWSSARSRPVGSMHGSSMRSSARIRSMGDDDLRQHIAATVAALGGQAALRPAGSGPLVGRTLDPFDSADDRFTVHCRQMVVGEPAESAKGVAHFLRVDDATLYQGMARGVDAIVDEFAISGSVEDNESLDYVLRQTAGVSRKSFPNGIRDCDASGRVLPERAGKRFADFVAHPSAIEAKLTEAQVLALRLYTTAVRRYRPRLIDATPRPFPERTLSSHGATSESLSHPFIPTVVVADARRRSNRSMSPCVTSAAQYRSEQPQG